MSRFATSVLLIAALFTAGCGGVPIKPDAIASLKSVSVSPNVVIAPKAAYNGPEQAWGAALGGLIGGLIAQGAVTAPDQIAAYLQQNNVNVGDIARQEFIKALQADPRFGPKLADNGECHFELEVYLWGLDQHGSFSLEYLAWLGVRAKLVDASGQVLWQDKDYVTRWTEGIPAATYDAYFIDPATFRDGFTTSARIIAAGLLRKI